ncbi:hypothetical protein J6590_017956 [Homalodisca vitripennis]|nr:hypothetical protein J6590_017956 [Homalodisca vitripennis]
MMTVGSSCVQTGAGELEAAGQAAVPQVPIVPVTSSPVAQQRKHCTLYHASRPSCAHVRDLDTSSPQHFTDCVNIFNYVQTVTSSKIENIWFKDVQQRTGSRQLRGGNEAYRDRVAVGWVAENNENCRKPDRWTV